MEKSKIHDLALTAAKYFIEFNIQEYQVSGYEKLVSDLAEKYQEAYDQIALEKNSKSAKMLH